MRVPPKITQALAVMILGVATLLTVVVLVFIIAFVLVKGLPGVTWEFLSSAPKDMGKAGGIFPTLVGTVLLPLLRLRFPIAITWHSRVPCVSAPTAWPESRPSFSACSGSSSLW